MIAAVRDESGVVAIHRTFLDLKPPRLARLPFPKRALGRLGEGAVRLRPPVGGLLGWAEGIENAIAATQLTGIPCWATLGAERFAHVAVPRAVRRLILFLDNDPGGRRAGRLAPDSFGSQALEIEARCPAAEGADWNDVLVGRALA
jgi:putative DNA primase/helicase